MAKSTTKKTDENEFSTSPPSHLSKESAAWFKRTVALYEFDEHHIKLLTLACEAFDRAVQARQGLEEHGLTFVDPNRLNVSFGPKATDLVFAAKTTRWARNGPKRPQQSPS